MKFAISITTLVAASIPSSLSFLSYFRSQASNFLLQIMALDVPRSFERFVQRRRDHPFFMVVEIPEGEGSETLCYIGSC